MKMKIFIGSASETLADLELIASWIEEFGHTPISWNDAAVFTPGLQFFTSLVDWAHSVDAAIFLFSEDDKILHRSDAMLQPRDNVMIEYGLFLGALGPHRVVFCRKGKPKTASDLLGVTYVDVSEGRRIAAKRNLRLWIEKILEQQTIPQLGGTLERLDSPFQALGKRTLFMRGTDLLQKAADRIALVARTPIPIVGTRPYGEAKHIAAYEKEQLDCFWRVLEKSAFSGKPEVRCVASIRALLDELRRVNTDSFRSMLIENVNLFHEYAGKNGACQLLYSHHSSSLTYLVADSSFIVWFKDAAGESVWITASNDSVSDALYDMAARDASPMELDELKLALSLV